MNVPSVVPFPSSHRAPKGLWGQLTQKTAEHLRHSLNTFLDKSDDTLFDLSENAPSNLGFFDTLRALRVQRSRVIETVVRKVDAAWTLCERADEPVFKDAETPKLKLALVEDESLEEGLAIEAAVRNAQTAGHIELLALQARLAALKNDVPAEAVKVPVAPEAIIEAFREGLQALERGDSLTTEVKIVIYKLFDREVLSHSHDLYADLNRLLIGAGLLRQWKPPGATQSHTPPPPRARGEDSARPSAEGGAVVPAIMRLPPVPQPEGEAAAAASWLPATADSSVLLNMIHTLASTIRVGAGGAPLLSMDPNAPAPGPPVSVTDLLSALALVRQRREEEAFFFKPDPNAPAVDPLSQADQLKTDLRSVLSDQAGGGQDGQPVLGVNEGVIDLVSMMFEYVAHDNVLSSKLQADLGRLQMPFLRMGILEPVLFAKEDHPARQLLNTLSEAGKRYAQEGPDAEQAKPIEEQIHALIERVASANTPDHGLFEKELSGFKAFLAQIDRRSESRTRRLTENIQGMDRKSEATRAVAGYVLPYVRNGNFPNWLSLLLLRSWSSALVLARLREGPDSDAYRLGIRWMEHLDKLNHMQAGPDMSRALNANWEKMAKVWSDMLKRVAMGEEDLNRWTQALHQWLLTKAAGQPIAADPVLNSSAKSLPHIELPIQTPAAPVSTPPAGGTAPIKQLSMGAFIEVSGKPGQPARRGKLVYMSAFNNKMLFVTSAGETLLNISPEGLRAGESEGFIKVLPTASLFDRAMGSVLGRLRKSHAVSEEASTAV